MSLSSSFNQSESQSQIQFQFHEIQIAENYILNGKKKLGSGAFGEIYLGTIIGEDKEVAIKLEQIKTKHPQIFYESKIYMSLKGGIGIPNIYWCGTQGVYNILIIECLGQSLEALFNYCGHKFTLKTSVMVIEQMLSRIEYVHSKNFIHRDIKPDNFLIGRKKKKNIIYIIDFGLSKRFREAKTNIHIPYRDGRSLTGTARFASVNTHLGIEQSRRDDLESLGYVMVYFLRGSLPWQGLKAKTFSEKYNKIMKIKMQTSLENLCKGFPSEVEKFLYYTRDLMFDEKPDYNFLHKLLKDICEKNNFLIDNTFDWNIKYTNNLSSINNANNPIKIKKQEDNKINTNFTEDIQKNLE